jgi:hypothetical protein
MIRFLTVRFIPQIIPSLANFSPAIDPPDISRPLLDTISPLGFSTAEVLSVPTKFNSFDHLSLMSLAYPDNEPSQPPNREECARNYDYADGRTTLYLLAYRLIALYNRRGINLDIVHIRMQNRFRLGRTLVEGCRVDNQVLLTVLIDIS